MIEVVDFVEVVAGLVVVVLALVAALVVLAVVVVPLVVVVVEFVLLAIAPDVAVSRWSSWLVSAGAEGGGIGLGVDVEGIEGTVAEFDGGLYLRV